MSDSTINDAFSSGAQHLTIMRMGSRYVATLSAFRNVGSNASGAELTEHASLRGEGPDPQSAIRDAMSKIVQPPIEVREITVSHGRKIVPLSLAAANTKVKGLSDPPAESVEPPAAATEAG